MSYSCKILLDSISETDKRITTMEITFPRIVLAEFNTHRMFSRNSASSRAIPINKMIERVRTNPFIPEKWGKPVKGMGAKEYWPLDSTEHLNLKMLWESALNNSINLVSAAKDFGNKEDLNRLLEPFMYHTAIITATEWDNFFKLRTNEAADWKIRKIADLMYEAYHIANKDRYEISHPNLPMIKELKVGEWHCPLVSEEDNDSFADILLTGEWKNYVEETNVLKLTKDAEFIFRELKKMVSVARCARVSYLTHDGKRDIEKDLELFERLRTSGHYSPFEHVATPSFKKVSNEFAEKAEFENLRNGNFIGWRQMRQDLPNENCTSFRKGEN